MADPNGLRAPVYQPESPHNPGDSRRFWTKLPLWKLIPIPEDLRKLNREQFAALGGQNRRIPEFEHTGLGNGLGSPHRAGLGRIRALKRPKRARSCQDRRCSF